MYAYYSRGPKIEKESRPGEVSIVEDLYGGATISQFRNSDPDNEHRRRHCNHDGYGGNVLFLDGHVIWARSAEGGDDGWSSYNGYTGQ